MSTQTQILTYTYPVRRFFVHGDEKTLIETLKIEIWAIFCHKIADGTFKKTSLSDFYSYVDMRIYSLNDMRENTAVFLRLNAHMKDYCDENWERVSGKLPTRMNRMNQYSEPLLGDKKWNKNR